MMTGDKLSKQEVSHPCSVMDHYRSGRNRWEAEVKCANTLKGTHSERQCGSVGTTIAGHLYLRAEREGNAEGLFLHGTYSAK